MLLTVGYRYLRSNGSMMSGDEPPSLSSMTQFPSGGVREDTGGRSQTSSHGGLSSLLRSGAAAETGKLAPPIHDGGAEPSSFCDPMNGSGMRRSAGRSSSFTVESALPKVEEEDGGLLTVVVDPREQQDGDDALSSYDDETSSDDGVAKSAVTHPNRVPLADGSSESGSEGGRKNSDSDNNGQDSGDSSSNCDEGNGSSLSNHISPQHARKSLPRRIAASDSGQGLDHHFGSSGELGDARAKQQPSNLVATTTSADEKHLAAPLSLLASRPSPCGSPCPPVRSASGAFSKSSGQEVAGGYVNVQSLRRGSVTGHSMRRSSVSAGSYMPDSSGVFRTTDAFSIRATNLGDGASDDMLHAPEKAYSVVSGSTAGSAERQRVRAMSCLLMWSRRRQLPFGSSRDSESESPGGASCLPSRRCCCNLLNLLNCPPVPASVFSQEAKLRSDLRSLERRSIGVVAWFHRIACAAIVLLATMAFVYYGRFKAEMDYYGDQEKVRARSVSRLCLSLSLSCFFVLTICLLIDDVTH